MSPYRLPPAQPRPAPAAPWWRVAWAAVSRSLLQRLRDREARAVVRSLRPWLTEEEGQRAYDAVHDAKGNFIGEQRPRWNIGNVPANPRPPRDVVA